MKKYLIPFLFQLLLALHVQAEGNPAESFTLTPSVTTVAASATNTTAGTIKILNGGETPVRIWVSASGIGASTNGVSAVSNLVVKLSVASGSSGVTNAFDTAAFSNVKVTLPVTGVTTNVQSDWFVLSGCRYIRIGQIENNTLGVVSNISVTIGYPRQ